MHSILRTSSTACARRAVLRRRNCQIAGAPGTAWRTPGTNPEGEYNTIINWSWSPWPSSSVSGTQKAILLRCSNSSCSSSTGSRRKGLTSVSGRAQNLAPRASGAAAASSSEAPSGDGYWTLTSYVLYEYEVKKSKFLVRAWPVSSASEAMSLIRTASDPSASHNCFAYMLGDEFRCSDDGEPGGTAGRPIQSAIEGEGLDRVAVLVTRYFGGIKLGAGGLVRAYGGAARECLRLAPRTFAKAQVEVLVEVAYDELGIVYGCLDMHGCARLAEEYGSSGTVTLWVRVDAEKLAALTAAVADGTGGRRRVERAAALTAAGTDS